MGKEKKKTNIIETAISLFRGIIRFLTHDIWEIGDRNLSKTKALALSLLRKIILSIKGFVKSELMARSTSLSFRTVLAVCPKG